MPHRRQFPNAVRALVLAVAGGEREIGHRIAVLVEDGLPQFVVVAPGADDQEIEILAAAMKQHEPKAARFERGPFEIGAGQARYVIGNGAIFGLDGVPLEDGAGRFDRVTGPDLLGRVAIAGADAGVGRENAGEVGGLESHGPMVLRGGEVRFLCAQDTSPSRVGAVQISGHEHGKERRGTPRQARG
jgi:hypothetical protein